MGCFKQQYFYGFLVLILLIGKTYEVSLEEDLTLTYTQKLLLDKVTKLEQ